MKRSQDSLPNTRKSVQHYSLSYCANKHQIAIGDLLHANCDWEGGYGCKAAEAGGCGGEAMVIRITGSSLNEIDSS
jgi:hypothetical protein